MTAVEVPPTFDDARIVAHLDELDRADWLDLRRGGIGGSDAAAICGQDRWRSAFEVWLDKTAAPNLPEDQGSEAAEWGTLLEPIVRQQAAVRTGLDIVRVPYLLQSTEHRFMLASPDGVAGDDLTYEGKTAGLFVGPEWGDDADPLVPDAYLLQGMHYLAVTGRQRLLYAVLIGGQRLVLRWVERDQELIDHLVTIEEAFWQSVLDGTPPAPDGSKACTELLAHLYDVQADLVVPMDNPAEVRRLLVERQALKDKAALLEEQADEIANGLKVRLGNGEVAVDGDGQALFTWKQHDVTRLDTKALKADRPQVHAAFSKTTKQRTFRVPKGAI